jgi:hypothetical protein
MANAVALIVSRSTIRRLHEELSRSGEYLGPGSTVTSDDVRGGSTCSRELIDTPVVGTRGASARSAPS